MSMSCSLLTASPTSPFPSLFYRAMHFSDAKACRPSVRLVRLSVTLVICDHTGWKSWKLIARTISPTPSLFVAKRRPTPRETCGNFGETRGGVREKVAFWRTKAAMAYI